jgi:hypothetical protein
MTYCGRAQHWIQVRCIFLLLKLLSSVWKERQIHSTNILKMSKNNLNKTGSTCQITHVFTVQMYSKIYFSSSFRFCLHIYLYSTPLMYYRLLNSKAPNKLYHIANPVGSPTDRIRIGTGCCLLRGTATVSAAGCPR